MNIKLYKMSCEDNRIDKTSFLTYVLEYEGSLRTETSLLNPQIDIQHGGKSDFTQFNYAYIKDFNRYYFIDDITSVRTYISRLHMRCDVLMSYVHSIGQLPCIVARTSNEEYVSKDLVDDRIPIKPTFTRTIEYEYPLSPVITNNSASRNNSILVTIGQVDIDLNDGSVGTDYDNSYFNIPSWQLTGNSNSMCHYIFARAELATFLEKYMLIQSCFHI